MERTSYHNWPDHFADPSWFTHDRFGMFIHYGLYALPARHEWVMTHEQIPFDTYKNYANYFEPDQSAVTEWLDTAVETGMKYVVLTTKHHDGFCLFDSALTDYKVTNTAFKQDLVKIFCEEARKRDLKVGFYYSLIDWSHPHFVLDGLHPERDNLAKREQMTTQNMGIYRDYMKGQITELLTHYGKIDYMWYDFSYPHRDFGFSKGKGEKDWDGSGIEALTRKLQPHILINDRLDVSRGIKTPEQYQPQQPLFDSGKPVLFEACQTLNDSWGYDIYSKNWKSSDQLIKMLIDTISKDGNFLLNIGPTARGYLDDETKARLTDMKTWMKQHERAIIGCHASRFTAPVDCRLTQNKKRLYVHIFSYPFKHIHLKDLKKHIKYARFLHDHAEVRFDTFDQDQVITSTETDIAPNDIVLNLPVIKPNVTVPVVEIFLK